MSCKVIADHIRSLSVAIGDGALPGNEGRGYVLRRLLRRASMHGQKLGIEGTFLYKLVPTVGKIMESYYPEVLEKQDFIEKIIKSEKRLIKESSSYRLLLVYSFFICLYFPWFYFKNMCIIILDTLEIN